MDHDQTWIVEHLIAYWSGDPSAAGEEARRTCRGIVAELAASMSALDLLVLQDEPRRHRRQIEERVAAWLSQRGPSRDLLVAKENPSLPPRPLPTSAAPAAQAAPPQPMAPVTRPNTAAAPEPAASDRRGGSRFEQHVQGGYAVGEVHGGQGGIHFGLTVPAAPSAVEAATARAEAATAEKTVRILFLGSNPADSTPLRLGEEVREIELALASAELGRRCELTQKWAVRVADLQGYLLSTKPHVLHFSGHGGHQSAVVLETEDGASRPVDALRLANMLRLFNRRLRCVVLNACYSAEQAEAISQHIDCVVGMSAAVADRAAICFSAAFYRAVASGCSVQEAFDQACADIEVGELGQDEVPALVATRCDPSKLVLVDAR